MPAVSQAQHGFFGAELRRALKGEHTETGLSIEKIKEFLHGAVKNLPKRIKKKKRHH